MRLERAASGGVPGALVFQFHKGAIRTTYQNRLLQEQFNFNSIKVRLEPQVAPDVGSTIAFQFHKGAIRTISITRLPRIWLLISIP